MLRFDQRRARPDQDRQRHAAAAMAAALVHAHGHRDHTMRRSLLLVFWLCVAAAAADLCHNGKCESMLMLPRPASHSSPSTNAWVGKAQLHAEDIAAMPVWQV
eukprot:6190369-Pleurochrysis_carterae.AAC.8